MLARRTGRRRINEALAVVSPLSFADAVRSYVTGLQQDDLRALVLRSIKRMDPSERTQFALFLGHDAGSGGIDDIFSGSSMPVTEVQRLVESCKDFLPNRFAAFLHENPRAVPALGDEAIQSILATLPQVQAQPSALEERKRRVRMQSATVLTVTLLLALVPLVAQYARQRGMLAGISNASFAPSSAPRTAAAAPVGPAPVAVRHSSAPSGTRAPKKHVVPKHVVAIAHVRTYGQKTRIAARTPVHTRKPARIAQVWKFDPRSNPYTRARHYTSVAPAAPALAHAPAPARAVAQTRSMNPFEARARLAVSSYLEAVIAGNTPSALAHLGLPRDADPKAISESAIVARGTKAQIVAVKPAEGGETHVQVDIMGRRGEYFEVFSVAPDGPAVRIKDRFYIPVNRTAEEISARLLAKITH